MIGIEPRKSHKIQGLKNMKESYPPGIFKPEEPAAIVGVDDNAAYEMSRRLAREEGIFVGMSAGAAMRVALDEARRLGRGVVVALLPDGGERYLSTSLFLSETVPEPLRFYNTLTKSVEQLQPGTPGKVSIYSCGPSLDGPPDLGLCRRVVFSDILRRYLEYRGYEVKHAMNLGDIDNRTVNECLKAGGKLKEFTAQWEKAFFQDLDALGVLRAQHYLRASEHIGDMVEQAREPAGKRHRLREASLDLLPHQQVPGLRQALRGGPGPNAARGLHALRLLREGQSAQFRGLLKRPTLAELKAGIFWQTPWGKVRPGWHVECTSMAVRCLGQPLDIHTASTDLCFPHGDNEIAIAASLSGKPLARFWMHCEVVKAGGKKPSRALGNSLTMADLAAQGFDGPTVRYWLLATHYRTVLNYSVEELKRAKQSVSRLNAFAKRLRGCAPRAGAGTSMRPWTKPARPGNTPWTTI